MKISTWKDSTGTFVSAITSIGTYYPVGPLGSYRLSASMASAGQTAKLEVVTLTGENKGFLGISVSGTASSFAISTPGNVAILNSDIGIKVSAISGTVTLLMDDGRGVVIKNGYAEASLVEILSATKIPTGIRARPFDVAGCTLEMGADGLWTGVSVGTLTQVQADALVASGVLASVKVGTPATINGQQTTWEGPVLLWRLVTEYSDSTNATSANMKSYRRALARSRSGGAPVKISLIGDSTVRGAGSNGSPSIDVIKKSFPSALADIMSKILNVQSQSVFGDGTFGVSISVLDPRVVMLGGFSTSSVSTIGGNAFKTSTAGTLSFTPDKPCRYFDVFYVHSSGNGVFSLDVGGVGTTNFNTGVSGTSTLEKATIDAGSATLLPLNIKYVSGNVFFIIGISGRSDDDQVEIFNLGRSGSKVSDWIASTGAPWDPLPASKSLSPDLTIICLTINDAAQSTNIPEYKTGLQTIIDNSLSTGSAILLIGAPTNTTISTQVNQDNVRRAVIQLSESNSVPVIDLVSRFQSWIDAFNSGFMYDNYHPNAIGYSDIASVIFKTLNITGN